MSEVFLDTRSTSPFGTRPRFALLLDVLDCQCTNAHTRKRESFSLFVAVNLTASACCTNKRSLGRWLVARLIGTGKPFDVSCVRSAGSQNRTRFIGANLFLQRRCDSFQVFVVIPYSNITDFLPCYEAFGFRVASANFAAIH